MTAHPAQPSAFESVEHLLDEALSALESVRSTIRTTRPTRAQKDTMRRFLAGVVADVETVRMALK